MVDLTNGKKCILSTIIYGIVTIRDDIIHRKLGEEEERKL